MVKFLIIVLGVGWILIQLIRYFLRTKLARFAQQVAEAERNQRREQRAHSSKEDGVQVDFIPKDQDAKRKKDIDGGEYVDFEEVKE